MSKTTIPTGGIGADAITAAKIADDAVSEEHLDATAITGATELAESPADTDEFLISDGGVLKRLDASYIGGGGFEFIKSTRSTSAAAAAQLNDITSSAYDHYRVIGTCVPASDNVDFFFHARTGSPTNDNYTGSNAYTWDYGARYRNSSAQGRYENGTHNGDTKWKFGDNVNADADSHYIAFDLMLYDWGTNIHSRCMWRGAMINNQDSGSGIHIGYGGGKLTSNINATGIGFSFSSGNVAEHSISCFGIKKT